MATAVASPSTSREQQMRKVERLLRKKPKTAGEIAEELGLKSGQGISRSLGELVYEGRAILHDGRYATYTRP